MPAVPVAGAFALGICGDVWWGGDALGWIVAGLMLALSWWMCRDEAPRFALILLLGGCVAAGGARQHVFESWAQPNDVAHLVTANELPVTLRGRVASRPYLVTRPTRAAWQAQEYTICTLASEAIRDGKNVRDVSGTVRLQIAGEFDAVQVGDLIEVQGGLSGPRGATNPGGFDYRAYLASSGVHAIVRCEHPEGIRVLERRGPFQGWRAMLQARCERAIASALSERTAPVGTALLLGTRSSMDDDVREAFVESGTMHVLAISGMHVAILAGFLYTLCRAANLSLWTTALLVIAVVCGYAFVTEARPPVVRAVVLVLLTAAAVPAFRPVSAGNLLAVAALVVMAWRPVDLFDTGAQLSFLAVAAILWTAPWMRAIQARGRTARIQGVPVESAWWRRGARYAANWTLAVIVVSAAISLFTAPLIASRFHLVSPVGLVVNILLMPVASATLISGFLLMCSGLLGLPLLTPAVAWVFDRLLAFLLAVVDGAARVHLGHAYIAGPGNGWLLVFYALIAAAILLPFSPRMRRWSFSLVGLWFCWGLAGGLVQARPDGLRCTFLSVGHGCAILVETPSGRTLAYDTGSIADGRRAAQALQAALWHDGHNHLDVLVVSHADADHYNGVPDLLSTIPVGAACIAPSFLDFAQEGVVSVCEAARTRNLPLNFVAAGDRLRLDPEIEIEVLHPGLTEDHGTDNANSIVLKIEYAGRRLLLTGDLERAGLEALLSQPIEPIDVLLSPHHGSRVSNVPELAAWARPRNVVSSQGRRTRTDLGAIFGPACRVYRTSESGAVTVEVSAEGEVGMRAYLEEE